MSRGLFRVRCLSHPICSNRRWELSVVIQDKLDSSLPSSPPTSTPAPSRCLLGPSLSVGLNDPTCALGVLCDRPSPCTPSGLRRRRNGAFVGAAPVQFWHSRRTRSRNVAASWLLCFIASTMVLMSDLIGDRRKLPIQIRQACKAKYMQKEGFCQVPVDGNIGELLSFERASRSEHRNTVTIHSQR